MVCNSKGVDPYIIFLVDICKNLTAPTNGRLNCSSKDDYKMQCVITCENGYDFALEPINFNVVDDELLLKCNSSDHIWETNHLPECSGIYVIFIKNHRLS